MILAVESGYRESTESWAAILRDLERRGVQPPKLVIGDGHLGIWGALAAVFPEAREPRCWNHRIVNLLDKLPLQRQAEARSLHTKIPYATTREEAERQQRAFRTWCTKRGHADVGRALDRDRERRRSPDHAENRPVTGKSDVPAEHYRPGGRGAGTRGWWCKAENDGSVNWALMPPVLLRDPDYWRRIRDDLLGTAI